MKIIIGEELSARFQPIDRQPVSAPADAFITGGKKDGAEEKRTALELEEREGLCYCADRTAALPQRRSDVVDSVADFLRRAQASYEDRTVS